MVNQMPELPLVIENQILMSPGVWNGINYSLSEIKKAVAGTNWNNESVLSLFLDHPENPNNAAGAWVGRIFNPHMVGDDLVADLKIFDLNTAIKLKIGGANFGVSPRVVSDEEQTDDNFKNFLFDNFSVVSKPAIDTAYIELAKQKNKSGGKMLFKTSGDPNYIQLNKSHLTDMKGGKIEMSEAKENTEETATGGSESQKKPAEESKEESKDESKEASKEESKNESEASEESKEMNFEDLSAEELDAIIAKAQKARDAKMRAIKEMSKEVIAPVSKEVEALKKQVKELSEKLDKPSPRTVKGSVVASENLVGGSHTKGEQEMAAYLERNFK